MWPNFNFCSLIKVHYCLRNYNIQQKVEVGRLSEGHHGELLPATDFQKITLAVCGTGETNLGLILHECLNNGCGSRGNTPPCRDVQAHTFITPVYTQGLRIHTAHSEVREKGRRKRRRRSTQIMGADVPSIPGNLGTHTHTHNGVLGKCYSCQLPRVQHSNCLSSWTMQNYHPSIHPSIHYSIVHQFINP